MFVQSNVPGTGYIAAGPAALAKAAGVPITALTENVPINDANSVALKLVNEAGSNGSVVLNFTPPEALVILQAAQKLGLEDRVKSWGCSTPCNTDFLAKALGPKWNHKLFVNAELTDARRPQRPGDAALQDDPRPVRPERRRRHRLVQPDRLPAGQVLVKALVKVKAPYTIKNVNTAFDGIKDVKTELLCQPWVYGPYPLHIPNNADFTVDAGQREDGHGPGLHADLGRRSADRAVPKGRDGRRSTNPPSP